ncbi:prolyl oligopeptidase family serine peptidase [Brevundimonas sp.]|uniref:S9 family peptidase n=1 Tax=Brevundimonas sp. TaxID=1871086 RepID=UPI00289866E5|nr:prolyl oligopeptidase family serine peptidase [Brevundimonas sp.]
MSAIAALVFACPSTGMAEPLTLDILLGLETFGRVTVDPTGRTVVFEERRARGDLPRYDLQGEGAVRYAGLYRYEVGSDGVRPLLPMTSTAGYTAGPFSPDGERLVVFRLEGLTYRVGIVTLASGAVLWTDIAPETGAWGRSVEWISSTEVIVLGMPNGEMPPRMAEANRVQVELPSLWGRASRGEAAYVSVGVDAAQIERPGRTLWRLNADTGRTVALAHGAFLDFETSPDGRHVALLSDGRLLPPAAADAPTEVRRARGLVLVDIGSGRSVAPAEAWNISTSLLAWSPASDAILVVSVTEPSARALVVTEAGAVTDVTPSDATASASVDFFGLATAKGGWLGDVPVVWGAVAGEPGLVILNGDGPNLRVASITESARVVAQGTGALLVADRGRILRLLSDRTVSDLGSAVALDRWDGPLGVRSQSDGMKAGATGVAGGDGQVCRVTPDPSPPICAPGSGRAAISWTHRASFAVGAEGRGQNRLEMTTGEGVSTIRALNPELDTVETSTPRLVAGPDGARGWLYLPPGPTPTPPAVIVIPYPARTYPAPPRTMRAESVQLSLNGELLVAAGYAVLFPDLPPNEEPALDLADRLLAVVDAAAEEGLVDANRIGLWGWSFGAWASVMSAAQSPRIKAVVALNGVYNLAPAIGSLTPQGVLTADHDGSAVGSARWLEAGQVEMGAPYWSNPDRYRRASPFEHADKITAAILFVSSELDLAQRQAEAMYAALYRLQRPVALTYLYGEDHGIQNPGNAQVYYQQVLDWFDRHLSAEAPPAAPSSAGTTPRSTPD